MELWKDLVRIAESRAPVDIRQEEDLCQEMTFENHHNATEREAEVLRKALRERVLGRAMVFRTKDARQIDNLCLGRWKKKSRSVLSTT